MILKDENGVGMSVDVIQERCLFPEEWWGLDSLEKENLEKVSRIHGAKFVHSKGSKAKATC